MDKVYLSIYQSIYLSIYDDKKGPSINRGTVQQPLIMFKSERCTPSKAYTCQEILLNKLVIVDGSFPHYEPYLP